MSEAVTVVLKRETAQKLLESAPPSMTMRPSQRDLYHALHVALRPSNEPSTSGGGRDAA